MWVLGLLFIIEFLAWFAIYECRLFISRDELFPEVKQSLLEKFKSYDTLLGWDNKADTIKYEYCGTKEITYTYDEQGGRICFNQTDTVSLDTYGDSYCQCREVNDNETMQFYLSRSLGRRVTNYGVGNYGLDQVYLKYQNKKIAGNKDVIIIFTPYTFQRISSVWKHFLEPGNVLNFKPRFIIKNNILSLIKIPFKSKDEIANIGKYEEFLSKYDDFYSAAVQRIKRIPRTANLLTSYSYIQYVFKRISSLAGRIHLQRCSLFFASISSLFSISDRRKALLKNKSLFLHLLKAIQLEAKMRNDRIIFVLAPTIEDMAYQQKYGQLPYDLGFLVEHRITLNVFNGPSTSQVYRKLFVDEKWGGHYSAKGNYYFAKYIEGIIAGT
jgi:hypothetical protein